MRRLACAVLVLSLEVVGQTSASKGGGSPTGMPYTTAQNWSQNSTTALTAGSSNTLMLTPCPIGVDTSGQGMYEIYISDGTSSESVAVSGGTCTSGASSGTITFTPYFSHASYAIESGSSGIQETINSVCGTNTLHTQNGYCNITLPAIGHGYIYNRYQVYGTIFFHAYQSVLSGYGTRLECYGRGPCLQVGDLSNSNDYMNNTVEGINFATLKSYSSVLAYEGVNITKTSFTSGYATITTASPHGFRPGDMVTILFTDSSSYWGDAIVTDCGSGSTSATCTSSSTTFRYAHPGNPPSLNSPGVVAVAYSAILDNAGATHFIDIQYDLGGENGKFNNFFDFWDDENAVIERFSAVTGLNANLNWTSSFIFSGGQLNIGHNFAPVITLRDSSITAGNSNCVTDYNSNGLYIENTVCQSTGPWQFYSSTSTGNYQGAYFKNIYSESTIAANPACKSYPTSCSGATSPFPGTGIAGLIAGKTAGSGGFAAIHVAGSGGPLGEFQRGGSGSTPYTYYIVANDTTARTQTFPMAVLNWKSTCPSSCEPSIPVYWPRVANGTDTITYDVIRMKTPSGIGAVVPYAGGCGGGSYGTCGYVVQGLSQASACSGHLVCAYTDTSPSSTSAHTTDPSSYPVLGNYNGNITFWPGSIVSVDQSISVDQEVSPGVDVGLNGNPLQIARACAGYGVTAAGGGYTSCLSSITSQDVPAQTATLMTDGTVSGGYMSAVKGRLNFAMSPFAIELPHHIITLIDSQPALTEATVGYRPLASANDTWIGTDVPSRGVPASAGQLAFGAPLSITNYIRATGDGVQTNWLERLTSKQKTFAVPVRISDGNSFTLGDGSPLSRMKIYSINNIPASHVPPQSCVDVSGEARGLTRSDQVTSITPPGRLGNLSLNAYPGDEGAVILHFCNPSGSEAIIPAGAYSFLAVH
jgi:hypothetical protein